MNNKFTLFLIISTVISGLFWLLERLTFFFKKIIKKNIFFFNGKKISFKEYRIIKNKKINRYSYIISYKLLSKLKFLKKITCLFPMLLSVLLVRSFLFEPFRIPSGSMMPTLLVGDFIFVEKFAYGIKNPINQSILINTSHPKRGDLVVFKYPLNPSLNYIKRVIGLPGDKISYNPISKRITIQSDCLNKKICDKFFPVDYSDFILSNFVQTTELINSNKIINKFYEVPIDKEIDGNSIRLIQCKEHLNKKIKYNILISPDQYDQINMYYNQPKELLAEWTIPKGKYFMMGDNRDNSFDSRYWGLVPEENLIGKAVFVWMSLDKKDNSWPINIRLNRIGLIN